MRIGIIGLPGAGKTTLFDIVTDQAASTETAAGSVRIRTAMVDVPDPRVEVLVDLYKPKKITRARLEVSDIAGLTGDQDDERDRKAEAIDGELINVIGRNDALLHVVRAFESRRLPHPLGCVDPARDFRRLDSELILSDLVKVENRIERLEHSLKRGKVIPTAEQDQAELATLTRLLPELEAGRPLRAVQLSPDESKRLRGFQFLSAKPQLVVLNAGDEGPLPHLDLDLPRTETLAVRGRLERDMIELTDPDEREMFLAEYQVVGLARDRLIQGAYDLLDRMTFFTVGDDEVRAWEAPTGATAVECAGVIHTDLAKGFIRAEVTGYQDLVAAGSMATVKSQGKMRLEGRDKVIADGDILVVRFNV